MINISYFQEEYAFRVIDMHVDDFARLLDDMGFTYHVDERVIPMDDRSEPFRFGLFHTLHNKSKTCSVPQLMREVANVPYMVTLCRPFGTALSTRFKQMRKELRAVKRLDDTNPEVSVGEPVFDDIPSLMPTVIEVPEGQTFKPFPNAYAALWSNFYQEETDET